MTSLYFNLAVVDFIKPKLKFTLKNLKLMF